MPIYSAHKKGKLYLGATKVRKAYLGSTKVYSSGNVCTYIVDSGISYREEFDEEESVLSPKTFTPSKAGWTFVGWRIDAAASSAVQTSMTMGDSPVTLYAVFRQTVTVTYYNGSTMASSVAKDRYYNNGTILNPSFSLSQAAISGWSARGWSGSPAANGSILYANGATFTRDSNIAVYGAYQQTVTLSYSGNGNTGGATAAQTGTRYWNTGNVLNPTFTIRSNGFVKSGYTWQRWRLGSTGGTAYVAGAGITLEADNILYAEWLATNPTVFAKSSITAAPTVNDVNYYAVTTGSANGTYASITIPVAGYVRFSAGGAGGGEPNAYSYIQISLGAYKRASIDLVPHFTKNSDDSGDANWLLISGASSGNGTLPRSHEGVARTLTMDTSGVITIKHNTGWKSGNTAEYWIKSIILNL